jgi:hypothetical protein
MQVEIKTPSENYFVSKEDFDFLKHYVKNQNHMDHDYDRYAKIVGNLVNTKFGSEHIWGDEDAEIFDAIHNM